jgi:hypothetical protein
MTQSSNALDIISRQTGIFHGATYMTGTAMGSITSTSCTLTGTTFPSNPSGTPANGELVGALLVTAQVYGVILTYTSTSPAAITIDQWYSPTSSSGASTSNPSSGNWVVVPAFLPAVWMGLSTSTAAAVSTNAYLSQTGTSVSEIWNSGGGLNRAMSSSAHTVGQSTVVLTKTFTTTTADPGTSTVTTMGVFQHAVNAAPTTTTTGMMVYNTALSANAVLTNNGTDNVQITDTITVSAT